MSAVTTITIGADSFSVYGTQPELKSYLAGRTGTTNFDSASANNKKKAHVQATRWIDRQRWQSVPTDVVTPQPLEFPRVGLTDCNGTTVLDSVVPLGVCEGTFELVLIILGDVTAADKAGTAKNIKKAGAGSAQVEFFRGGDETGKPGGTPLPAVAWDLVKCFAGSGTGANSGSIGSGTDACSEFDSNDVYDLRQGQAFP